MRDIEECWAVSSGFEPVHLMCGTGFCFLLFPFLGVQFDILQ
jgi:hypothetical protein